MDVPTWILLSSRSGNTFDLLRLQPLKCNFCTRTDMYDCQLHQPFWNCISHILIFSLYFHISYFFFTCPGCSMGRRAKAGYDSLNLNVGAVWCCGGQCWRQIWAAKHAETILNSCLFPAKQKLRNARLPAFLFKHRHQNINKTSNHAPQERTKLLQYHRY